MSRRRRLLAVVLSVGLIAALAGCSAKPENSPVIRKKFAEIDEMKKEMQDATKALRTISGDMTVIKDQVSNLRAFSPDPEGQVEAVNKIKQLEERIAELEGGGAIFASTPVKETVKETPKVTTPAATEIAMVATKTTPVDAFPGLAGPEGAADEMPAPVEQPKAVVTEAPKTTPAPAPKKASSESTSTKKSSSSTKASTKSSSTKSSTKVASSTPRGKYYAIQGGDTLESIASKNGVSLEELKKANHLPSGARPLKGQQLFIPGKK